MRVKGQPDVVENAGSTYTVRFWDTTYLLARWHASGGQSTAVMIANLVQANVSGKMFFFDKGAGALTATHPFTMGQNHGYVLSSASVPGLTGKAVALEPATGVTFDPVPLSQ